jgi:hemerythrin-like domain-containing protein
LTNVSDSTLTLEGCRLTDAGNNGDNHVIAAPVIIAPTEVLVLAKTADTSVNGELPAVAYALATGPSEKALQMQLEPAAQNGHDNDLMANWCAASTSHFPSEHAWQREPPLRIATRGVRVRESRSSPGTLHAACMDSMAPGIHNTPRLAPRRAFLGTMTSVVGVAVVGCVSEAPSNDRHPESPHGPKEAEVTPGEDLMQEHGVLERILLIYEEVARRVERGEAFDATVVTTTAGIVRRFVEDYHERLEEKFVFPSLEAAKREEALVATLRRQHQRGREVTDQIVKLASATVSLEMATVLRGFIRMYRPHAAREDTVLFPAFRSVVGGAAYRELGEQFEEEEHARFGEHGFERTVTEIAKLEAMLGIGDLASFTP